MLTFFHCLQDNPLANGCVCEHARVHVVAAMKACVGQNCTDQLLMGKTGLCEV
jgi:hypothetical protein